MSDSDAGARPPLTLLPKPAGSPPAHTRNLSGNPELTFVIVQREPLFALIEKLKVLTPCDRNPERFHERKDDLVAALFEIATAPGPAANA